MSSGAVVRSLAFGPSAQARRRRGAHTPVRAARRTAQAGDARSDRTRELRGTRTPTRSDERDLRGILRSGEEEV